MIISYPKHTIQGQVWATVNAKKDSVGPRQITRIKAENPRMIGFVDGQGRDVYIDEKTGDCLRMN